MKNVEIKDRTTQPVPFGSALRDYLHWELKDQTDGSGLVYSRKAYRREGKYIN
ncbi:MAG TPA: hypothetical protein VFX58_10800 [Chitinophagaceae bacterium]|nr:hypothetical protein [Chitinophagaceae bacterium]